MELDRNDGYYKPLFFVHLLPLFGSHNFKHRVAKGKGYALFIHVPSGVYPLGANGSDEPPSFGRHYKINLYPINCSSCSLSQTTAQTVYCLGIASTSFIKPASSCGMESLSLAAKCMVISIQLDPLHPWPCYESYRYSSIYSMFQPDNILWRFAVGFLHLVNILPVS